MMAQKETVFKDLLFKQNPLFVLFLGLIPALAVSYSVETSLGMGLIGLGVLVLSSLLMTLINPLLDGTKKYIAHVMIVTLFVSLAGILTLTYAPALYSALGIYLPLLSVSSLMYLSLEKKHKERSLKNSLLQSLGSGLGFLGAILLIGIIRELVSSGGIAYGVYLPLSSSGTIINSSMYVLNQSVFNTAAGGFVVIGFLLGLFKGFKPTQEKGDDAA